MMCASKGLRTAGGALVLFGLACNADERLPPTDAALANGEFYYQCVDETDARCDLNGLQVGGEVVAVGGVFDLEFMYNAGSADLPEPTLRPVSGGILAEGEAFRMAADGLTGVLAIVDDREVVELEHVLGETISALGVIEITDDMEMGVLTVYVLPGETTVLRAQPQRQNGSPLAGALDYTWTVADGAVATLAEDETGNHRVTLTATGDLGDATTLTVESTMASLDVEVRLQKPPDPDTDTDGDDSGDGTTGSETGTGSTSGGGTGTDGGSTTDGGSDATTGTGSSGTTSGGGTTTGSGSGTGTGTTGAP